MNCRNISSQFSVLVKIVRKVRQNLKIPTYTTTFYSKCYPQVSSCSTNFRKNFSIFLIGSWVCMLTFYIKAENLILFFPCAFLQVVYPTFASLCGNWAYGRPSIVPFLCSHTYDIFFQNYIFSFFLVLFIPCFY